MLGLRAPQRLHLRAALDLEHAGRLGALDRLVDLRGRRSRMRERSIRSPRTRAISSTQRSTADSIPSPSRSIFRKPASAHESLSHCTRLRPSIAEGCTGQRSISGSVEITIPPGCWEAWRGRP